MKTIAYIIGYRCTDHDDRRLLNLKITIDWLLGLKTKLKEYDINLLVIVIEQYVVPKFHIEHCNFKQLEYLFVYNDGYYNRGWGFNVCFKNYVADYYFFADGDIIMNDRDMIHVFRTCFKYDAVNPYETIYDSTKEYMESNGKLELIDLDCNCNFKRIFPKRENTCFSGGIMGIRKYSMDLINGWDERFRGRGWEDYAFTSKIKLFLYSIKTYPYSALHLWHPWEKNTTREINEQLNLEYAKYNFCDYLNLINTHIEFGSPIKYAISTSSKPCNPSKKSISDDRYYFAKDYFDKLSRNYKKNTINIYLHLCDQLKELNEDGQPKESGGPSGDLPDLPGDDLPCYEEESCGPSGDLPDLPGDKLPCHEEDKECLEFSEQDKESVKEYDDELTHLHEFEPPIKVIDLLHEVEPIKDDLERLESKFKNILELLAACLDPEVQLNKESQVESEPVSKVEEVVEPAKESEPVPDVPELEEVEPVKVSEPVPDVPEPEEVEPVKVSEPVPEVEIESDLPVLPEIVEPIKVGAPELPVLSELPVLPEIVEPVQESVPLPEVEGEHISWVESEPALHALPEVVDVDQSSVVSNSISIGGTFTNTNAEVI